MDVGIGIPNCNPTMNAADIMEWARRAEAGGLSMLATSDRVAWPGYDPLICLTAAAAVTSRIKLLTSILLGPTRNPVLLAKNAATLDNLSGGRFFLGLAVGGREDDFVAAGQPFRGRGKRWNAELELMHRAWRGEPVSGSPVAVTRKPVNGESVPIILGGRIDASVDRMVKWGQGMTTGLASAEQVKVLIPQLRDKWETAGRAGQPRVIGYASFALGKAAEESAEKYTQSYYGSQAQALADRLLGALSRSDVAIRDTCARFEDAGVDDMVFDVGMGELDQVSRLVDALKR